MIVFQRNVIDYFDDLIFELYLNDYFSSLENAENYVDTILNFIESSITTFPTLKAPKKLKHFGTHYIFYKPNRRTTWFIFFEKRNENFLISKIINSHVSDANFLNQDF